MDTKPRIYRLDPSLWARMEEYLHAVMNTLKPSGRHIAELLIKRFPEAPSYTRMTEEVKQFVASMQGADKVNKPDFQKVDHSETEFVETAHGASFRGTYPANQFDSPEAYLKHKNIDLEKYQIIKMGLKTYQGFIKNAQEEPEIVTLNSIFVEFKPKEANTQESAIKVLFESFKSYVPPVPRFVYQKQEQTAAIINLYDAHIDKVCLVAETGYGSTVEDNIEAFEELFDRLLSNAASYKPELIIFPIGHDFFNTNGPTNTTKRGTPQATSVKSEDSFILGTRLLRRCIDKAKQLARVKVIVVKGNHSEDKDFYLGQVLDAVFEQDANVTLDTSRKQRKYEEYGKNLFAFGHGDKESKKIGQLPLMMAEEQKQAWARTTYRYFYLGDKHHQQEYQFLRSKDFIGCMVKMLRSVGTTDEWHYDNGYIGIPRTGEVEIHSKKKGMIGHHFAHAQYRQPPAVQ